MGFFRLDCFGNTLDFQAGPGGEQGVAHMANPSGNHIGMGWHGERQADVRVAIEPVIRPEPAIRGQADLRICAAALLDQFGEAPDELRAVIQEATVCACRLRLGSSVERRLHTG